MQYTLKRVVDTHPEWLNELKQKCYAMNGCLTTVHSELHINLSLFIADY